MRNIRATDQTGAEISDADVARSASLFVYVKVFGSLREIHFTKIITSRKVKKNGLWNYLQLWYEPVSDKMLSKVHQVYVERIAIVEKYIAKDSERRFIQLPHQYFDPNNSSGFTGTRKWYYDQKKRELEVQQKLILHAQIRRFLNNEKKDTTKQKPRLELYKACETRIGKLGQPELIKAFQAAVLDHSTHSFLQFNT